MTYVIAAYAASMIVVIAYAWSVYHRRRAIEQVWAARSEAGEAGAYGPGSPGNRAPTASGGVDDD